MHCLMLQMELRLWLLNNFYLLEIIIYYGLKYVYNWYGYDSWFIKPNTWTLILFF